MIRYWFILLTSAECGVTLWQLVFSHAVRCEQIPALQGDTSIPKEAEQEEDQIVAFLQALTDRYKPAESPL